MEGEELAAITIKTLIKAYAVDDLPGGLIDCRSSTVIGCPAPSYKLGVKAGLTSILPFSLDGQAGSEALQALIFIRYMEQLKDNGVILSTVQRMVPPDTRLKENGFPLADAAASILISLTEKKFDKGFKVLSTAIGQRAKGWDAVLEFVLKEVVEKVGLTKEMIQWSIAHRFSVSFLETVASILPECSHVTRDIYLEVDFGCADSFISLNRVFGKKYSTLNGIGLVWFAGRFGSVGVALLERYERS
jgi:hypothetical protein